jgi:transcriptional regulator with XRE-family HTH domain
MARQQQPSVTGLRLRQRRGELGLTVLALARKVGVTEGSIRQMEAGAMQNFLLSTGLRVAQSLECSPWWLAGTDEPTPVTIDAAGNRVS